MEHFFISIGKFDKENPEAVLAVHLMIKVFINFHSSYENNNLKKSPQKTFEKENLE